MKSLTLKTTLIAIALTAVASSSFAAPNNGPKPHCQLGKIAVLEDGMWQCKQPSIKAADSNMESHTKGKKLGQKKPERARPDYVITKVSRTQGNDKMLAVTVTNQGADASVVGSELYATVMGGDIGTAAIPMPELKAGQSQTTFVSFNQAPDRGSRIRVMADGNKHIKESKENNNTKYFTY
ncbi:MAG: hypothetical protein OEW89_11790 [Gammaproteobacteria bacterium]|nr:hypothetical protein [Gammaproteobacteria bacterium]MDH5593946.1 hypothetical protein [Gammaproteobacteria bacterium]MDH5613900.1 hypothetical protein [Gammaproteobacteria bacterium]